MRHTVDVLLHWLIENPSGHPPRGPRLSLPTRFDHQGKDWTCNAWSLVVEVKGIPDATGYQMGTASFLVADAPHNWLREGRRFVLFEGQIAVAEGEVKSDQN